MVTPGVLLGGKSRRMGFPKHLLRHRQSGRTLLQFQMQRMARCFGPGFVLGRNVPPDSSWVSLSDPPEFRGQGPLAGILSGLNRCDTEWLAVLAVDCPHFPPELYQHAESLAEEGADVVVFQDSEGRAHWLCGLYRNQLTEVLAAQLAGGYRAAKSLPKACSVQILQLPKEFGDDIFLNLNTSQGALRAGFLKPE